MNALESLKLMLEIIGPYMPKYEHPIEPKRSEWKLADVVVFK